MPRKATKTAKPPLLFLESPVRGARVQNVPEVRAAFNPKDFCTEKREHNSTHHSWVSPQFDTSLAAPPVRRGRRKCHSSTGVFQSYSQLPKKNTVCKFPSLTFKTRGRDEPRQQRNTNKKKVTECTAVSDEGNQPQGPCQTKRTVSSTQYTDAPKTQATSIRKRNVKRCCQSVTPSSRYLDQPETQSIQVTEKCAIPDGTSAPEANCFVLPPDVDTPKVLQEGGSYPSFSSEHLLLSRSSSPTCNHSLDILVTDTPERDYGMKVTWRRRRDLMLLLKERDLLSDSEILIHT
ncbi:RAD9, HUS1, RAD1-interacting nuclear orphan protein 1 [Antennarius striatus]|uniref:RAD9, HUS1, RAD1-interacting nuclear orphan protein 1 n=1 Tax=Antennarius striatus TaxID=241820 RepID=UPI0035AFCF85